MAAGVNGFLCISGANGILCISQWYLVYQWAVTIGRAIKLRDGMLLAAHAMRKTMYAQFLAFAKTFEYFTSRHVPEKASPFGRLLLFFEN